MGRYHHIPFNARIIRPRIKIFTENNSAYKKQCLLKKASLKYIKVSKCGKNDEVECSEDGVAICIKFIEMQSCASVGIHQPRVQHMGINSGVSCF